MLAYLRLEALKVQVVCQLGINFHRFDPPCFCAKFRCESRVLQAGIVSVEELQRWQCSLARAEAEGVLFCSLTMMLIAGRKP
jgi:hypothetical protein